MQNIIKYMPYAIIDYSSDGQIDYSIITDICCFDNWT